ncbi:MAG: histidine phosphatase family protein [Betaproteobacteria bacterium]
MLRLLAVAVILFAVAGCADIAERSEAPAAPRPGDPVVARLLEGGYVVYLRHGRTDSTYQDKPDKPGWWKYCDVRGHRPLSDDGRAQMLLIGAQLRALRIPVAKVASSEYCRAVDSALLLQLMPLELDPALNYTDAQRFSKRSDVKIANDLRALFSTVPPIGRNTILVGHVHGINPPIDPVFSQMQEAEAVVMKPQGEGKFQIVGRITVDKWSLREKN